MSSAACYNPKMPNWDAQQYRKFESQRTQAAEDLLAHVQVDNVQSVIDLGCGPGNSTVLLVKRFPKAKVIGVDNSQSMLDEARKTYPEIEFVRGDINDWRAETPACLIFANASLHWIDDHHQIFPHIFSQLRQGGVMAVQMPNNFYTFTHASIRELAASEKWISHFQNLQIRATIPVQEPGFYYDLLAEKSHSIDIWQTEYFHILNSPHDVVEWLKGSGLRPYLEALPPNQQADFIADYKSKIEKHCKKQIDGKVILPYPRFFLIAKAN